MLLLVTRHVTRPKSGLRGRSSGIFVLARPPAARPAALGSSPKGRVETKRSPGATLPHRVATGFLAYDVLRASLFPFPWVVATRRRVAQTMWKSFGEISFPIGLIALRLRKMFALRLLQLQLRLVLLAFRLWKSVSSALLLSFS